MVVFDLLYSLMLNFYKVTYVRNITDVEKIVKPIDSKLASSLTKDLTHMATLYDNFWIIL